MTRLFLAATLAATLSGCAISTPVPVAGISSSDWREAATADDRERLREWRTAFMEGLKQAKEAGHSADIAKEGVLLDPDSGLGGSIPNGTYRCKVVKLGSSSEGLLAFVAYPAFKCRVQQEKGLQGFAKLTGSQRPVGLIFPGDAMRQVFLGALALGDEQTAMQYGRDDERDMAGWIERIGPNRYRMIVPYPRYESVVDVFDLVPA